MFASRGSVIETFVHQISNELPITLTDAGVTRYFMSHDEAANLILASAMNKSNGVFVQNMGEEILVSKIVERLARNIGLPYTTKIIGLQPGEKLHEELYAGEYESTSVPEIVRVKTPSNLEIIDQVKRAGVPTDNKEAVRLIDALLKFS